MAKESFDGFIEITLQGCNDSIPIKSSVTSTVESLKKVWAEYFNSPGELCCVFDGFLLENNATLVGLGVVGDDTVLVFPKNDESAQFGEVRPRRCAEEISVGLNVLIGEEEGLVVLDPSTTGSESWDTWGPVFSKKLTLFFSEETLAELEQNEILDLTKVSQRFVRLVYDGDFSVEKEDIEYLLSDQENLDKVKERETEIFAAIHQFWLDHYQLPASPHTDYDSVFIGPERNANFSNYLAFPPTVQLRGVTWRTSLRDLMESYQEYTGTGCNIHTFPYLMFNNESYSLDEKVFDVYTESLSGLAYLPSHQHFSFSFDISKTEDLRCVDDLVNFIEGSDEINLEGRKRKKKKKRKGTSEDPKEASTKELKENEINLLNTESRIAEPKTDTQCIEKTLTDETLNDLSKNIVNESEDKKINLSKLEDLKTQFEFEIEKEKKNLEENEREEKYLLSLKDKDSRLTVQIGQVDQEISNISNGISSSDSEIHDLELRLRRVKLLKEKLSERQGEKMKKIRALEEEKRNLRQRINTEAGRCFEERTKTYDRIEQLKKKLILAIKDIEQLGDEEKDQPPPKSIKN